jgi:Rad3-related DNA helicase
MEYYDELSKKAKNGCLNTLTGNSWYMLCAMRSVNQGIGRVIRHIDDYGIILMLDYRYSQ